MLIFWFILQGFSEFYWMPHLTWKLLFSYVHFWLPISPIAFLICGVFNLQWKNGCEVRRRKCPHCYGAVPIWQYLFAAFCVLMLSTFNPLSSPMWTLCALTCGTHMLTLVDFVCAFWCSFIITTHPIYSSSHSASGPGQSLRLFLSLTALLYDKTKRLYFGLNVSLLVALVTQCVPFFKVIVTEGWQHLHVTKGQH